MNEKRRLVARSSRRVKNRLIGVGEAAELCRDLNEGGLPGDWFVVVRARSLDHRLGEPASFAEPEVRSSAKILDRVPGEEFAPLSQNSTWWRVPGGPTGQAQPGQSKPSGWLITRSERTARPIPMDCVARVTVDMTAGSPVAQVAGGCRSINARSVPKSPLRRPPLRPPTDREAD